MRAADGPRRTISGKLPRKAATAVALVLTLTACGGDPPADSPASAGRTTEWTVATTSPSATPSPTTPAPVATLSACALLDLGALERAGLRPDSPSGNVISRTDGAEAAAALGDRDALSMCDAGFAVSVQVNDMPDEARARQEAQTALDTAAGTPTAVRSELPGGQVPYGATVVDPEFGSASVQFQLRDLHVAIVLGYGSPGGLSVAQVQELLQGQLEHALAVLG